MSGWMKYPYKKCIECEYFDWDESDAIVDSPGWACNNEHDDCPEKDEGIYAIYKGQTEIIVRRMIDYINPIRKAVVNGHKVVERWYTGNIVVYVDNRLTKETYEEALKRLSAV